MSIPVKDRKKSRKSFLPCSGKALHYLALLFMVENADSQNFVGFNIDSDATFARGSSWIDFDNDGDLDLFVSDNDFFGPSNFDPARNQNRLYRNDGADNFVRIFPAAIANDTSFTLGHTWADYDNDGDIDLFAANDNYIYPAFLNSEVVTGASLFRNEGATTYDFTRIVSGDISGDNHISAFASAWADYNNDGFVDLFMTTPIATAFPNEDTLSNVLFDNNGDGTFSRNTSSSIVNGPVDFYTIPTWSDFDQDGDMDLTITSGPVRNGVLSPDYFYINQLIETGNPTFERDLTSLYATEQRDGQQANWIDYDNDGDLDLYITNFGGSPGGGPNATAGMANNLYKNNNGSFEKIPIGEHVNQIKVSFGQTWGDFDNDGDLDLYVTNLTTSRSTGGNDYYRNNGAPDYTFTRLPQGDFVAAGRAGWGATAGDYDNDGDLDLFATVNTLTAGAARDIVYRNDVENGNNWLNITCVGTISNRSAIGARVRVKATIFGNDYWQMREISAQNASNGQNSLRAHFGLGDAVNVDSLVIHWPLGTTDIITDFLPNKFITVTEAGEVTAIRQEPPGLARLFQMSQNFPNPFNPSTTIEFVLPDDADTSLRIYNLKGEIVRTIISETLRAGVHTVLWNGLDEAGRQVASGIYVYELRANQLTRTKKMLLLR